MPTTKTLIHPYLYHLLNKKSKTTFCKPVRSYVNDGSVQQEDCFSYGPTCISEIAGFRSTHKTDNKVVFGRPLENLVIVAEQVLKTTSVLYTEKSLLH